MDGQLGHAGFSMFFSIRGGASAWFPVDELSSWVARRHQAAQGLTNQFVQLMMDGQVDKGEL
jgi:hypothetical protein